MAKYFVGYFEKMKNLIAFAPHIYSLNTLYVKTKLILNARIEIKFGNGSVQIACIQVLMI